MIPCFLFPVCEGNVSVIACLGEAVYAKTSLRCFSKAPVGVKEVEWGNITDPQSEVENEAEWIHR